jgi:hypothetical protein
MEMGSTVADLRLGGTDEGACGARTAVSGGVRLCLFLLVSCFLVFSALCCVFSFVCLVQSACVLLIFYWNFCWLDAKLTIFYLRAIVNVKEAQM